jgi:AraC-like DNA-binding protein
MSRTPQSRDKVEATVRVGGIALIPGLLNELGVDAGLTLREAGIDPEIVADPNNIVTYSARSRLFQSCVAKTQCQHFGLLLGQRMGLNSLGLLGALVKSMENVNAALTILVNYFHIHTRGAVTALVIEDNVAMLRYSIVNPTEVAMIQTGDGAVAMMLNIMQSLCGKNFKPIEASFAHPAPADKTPFVKLLRAPLYFNAPYYSLIFDKKWLDTPLITADKELELLFKQQIEMIKIEHSVGFAQQVKQVLRSTLLTNHCSEMQIAKLFGLNERALIRRLQAAGTGFQELADECRFDMARQMLENTTLKIGEIADALGYARSSTFIRAFKRWSSVTPAVWRNAYFKRTA